MKKHLLYLLCSIITFISFGQNDLKDKSHYNDTYVPDAVIDKKYGIVMYEKLNMMIGSDTVRNDQNGYAANGYLEDYYTSGQLLHKGFYVEGQLKIYKNYFPNGNVERNFRLVDLKKSKMTIYYEDATIKSDIVYVMSEALKWQDYYPNGTLEFEEEYDKSFQYYKFKANYYENGTPENTLELIDKKKLIYNQTYYHPNGKVKEVGQIKYNKAEFDYQNIGVWKHYDNNGNPTKEVKYVNGQIQSEKSL